MVTIFSALAEGTKLLKEKGIDTPRLDCEVIMSHILNCSRLSLITGMHNVLKDGQYEKYRELLKSRLQGMPVAYITGKKEFMSLDFSVAPGILIPRGDTEIIVEKLLEECSRHKGRVYVADVGCGSGAIGISTAKYAENAIVTLIDISGSAIEVTAQNANDNGVKDRVRIVKGDLLLPVINERFNIIVSNPPYIETGVIPALQREVKDYEPLTALDGGPDGLDFYRRITVQAAKCLEDDGVLIYEIGYNQSQAVKDILDESNFRNIDIFKDLAGNDRCILGRR